MLAVDTAFLIALVRAFGGAMLFGLPLFMTMEMWWLGFIIPPERLAVFVVVGVASLWPLAWLAGFREESGWYDALIDAGVAWLVAVVASTLMLLLLAQIELGMSAHEMVGKIALQSVPAGMGAVLARSQLGMRGEEEGETERRRSFFASELFLMGIGSLFLAFNVVPTEEILLIAHRQASPWFSLFMIMASLAVMHGFVYAVGFRGQHEIAAGRSGVTEFVVLTLPGYALVLAVGLYVLWTFGRLEGQSAGVIRDLVLVMGFPGALGAATARLVL
jgi:putative integral membrane protein (TIGR02587 family)